MVRFKLLAAIILAVSGSLWAATPALTVANTAAYTEDASPTIIDGSANLTDGNDNFGNGSIQVQYITGVAGTPTTGASTDQLTIEAGGNVTVSASNILYSSVIIGSFTTDGTNGANLFIQLTTNGNTLRDNIRDVIRQVAYRTTSQAPASQKFIRITVSDDTSASNNEDVTINITAQNDVPVVDLNGAGAGVNTTAAFSETASIPVNIGVSDATITDVDNANLTSVTVVISSAPDGNKEILAATASGNITVGYTVGTHTLLLSGSDTLAQYMTVLRTVTYDNTDSKPTTTDRILTVVANDGSGTSASVQSTVTVQDLNDPPVNTVPGTQTINEDATRTFSAGVGNAISVSDADAGTANIEVTLNVTGGTVTLNGVTGLTFSVGDGTADATMTFQGTIAVINTRLDGLVFTPTPNLNGTGAGAIQIVANDLGNTGSGGAQSDTDSVSIDITAVNDAPVLTGTSTLAAVNEDATNPAGNTVTNLLTGQLTDVDSGSSLGGIAITDNAATGGQGTWQYSSNGGTDWFAVGSPTGSAALAVAAGSSIRFLPASNFNGTPGVLTYRALDNTYAGGFSTTAGTETRVTVDTSTNGTTTAISLATSTITTSINAVNDAPVLTGTSTLAAVNEDTTNPAGNTVTNLLTGQVADVDSGSSLGGIAITDNAATGGQGTWQYSSNGGTDWFAVGSPTGSAALAVAAGSSIRFLPASNFNGTPGVLTYRALDNTYAGGFSTTAGTETRVTVDTSTNGTTTAISAATSTIVTSITAVNDVPVVDLNGVGAGFDTTANFLEVPGTPVNIGVSAATITDVDDTQLQSVTVRITNEQDNNKELLDATAIAGITVTYSVMTETLTLSGTASIADYITVLRTVTYDNTDSRPTVSPSRIITVTARDAAGGDAVVANSTLTITDVNDPPVNTVPITQTINEDATRTFSSGVGNAISVSDSDAGTDVIEVTLNVTGGTVTLSGTTGLTFSVGNGTAGATMTFQGTITDINARLNGLVFTPTLNLNGTGAGAIQIVTDDLGNNGGGGAQTDTDSVSIDITALNDAPVVATGTIQDLTVNEDSGVTSLAFDASISPARAALTFAPGGGADELTQVVPSPITLVTTTGIRVDTVPPASLGTIFKLGSVAVAANDDLTLVELQSLTFVPASNRNNLTNPGTNQLQFSVFDSGPSGVGDVNVTQFTVLISVTQVNDVPTITDPTDPLAVNEDAAAVSVALIPLTFVEGPAEEPGTQNLLRYNIVSVTSSGNIAFTVLPAISNAGQLTYTLAPNTNGTATVVFNGQDDGGTSNGGVDTSTPESFVITVTAVNDAPVNTVPATQTILEDAANVAFLTPISVSDIDIAEASATFGVTVSASTGTLTATNSGTAVVSGSTTGTMVISSGNAADTNAVLNSIRYTATPGLSGSPASVITVVTTDNGGTGLVTALLDTDAFNINITAVNDAPVVNAVAGAATYNENDPTVLINAITVTDEDSTDFVGGSVSVAITAGSESTDVLEIVQNGTVTVVAGSVFVGATPVATVSGGTSGTPLTLGTLLAGATPANIQTILQRVGFRSTSERPLGTARTVTFTVNDGDGAANGGADTDTATATVNVTPINDAPAITLTAANTYTENGTPGALVGVATLTDSDSDDFAGGSLTLSITNINEAGDILEVVPGGNVSVAGNVVSVSSVAVANVAGGTAGAPLSFSNFTTNTTPARLLEVLQSIRFRSTSERPPETARNVSVSLNDGDGTANSGVDTVTVAQTVNVDEVNDVVAITSSNKTPIFTFDTTGTVNTIANVALPGQKIIFTIDAKDTDDPITFLWDFNDGSTDPGTTTSNNVLLNDGSVVNFSGNTVTNTVTHTFAKAGVYTVRVSAKDGRGADDPSNTIQIIVNSPPREKPNTGGAQPPLDSGLIALTDFLKLTQPQTYTVLLAGLTANTDEDGDPLTYTFDLGDGTTTTVTTNSVDTAYPLLPQTAVVQENGLSSILVKVTVTDVPQTPGVPAGSLTLTRQIFFTEPIVGAAVDDIDVFNPNQGLTALGINSQGNRGAVIQFDVVNAKSPLLSIIPMGQETGALKDFFSPAKDNITGLAVLNSPAGTFRFFVQFKKAGLYLAQITDSDGRIVRKMIPITVPDITGAQRELQDFNVSSSFITGKLNFTGGKADQLKFRARFPLVNNSLYSFDSKKEFELIVGIGNIAVTLNVPPTGRAKIMAIRDALGNVRQPAKGTEVRFKAPKSTNPADGVKNPTRIQAIVDFRLALEDIDLAGLDSEGVTQEHGTVTNGEVVLNTGGLLGGATLSDSKIDVGSTGVQVNTVQATLKQNNLVPIGIQTIFLIDRQLAYASKIPAGFIAKKNFGQLAGKK